jgi:hypothetical protein
MEPMIEHDRGETRFFRIIIQNDPAVFIRERPPLFDAGLRHGQTGHSKNYDHD